MLHAAPPVRLSLQGSGKFRLHRKRPLVGGSPAKQPRVPRQGFTVPQSSPEPSQGPAQHTGRSRAQAVVSGVKRFLQQAVSILPKLQVPAGSHVFASAAFILAVTILLGVFTFAVDQGFATVLLQFEQFRSVPT